MNVYSTMFLLAFLAVFILSLYKFYNMLKLGQVYDLNMSWIIFVSILFLWLIQFIALANYPENLMYSQLFKISNLFVGWNILSLFIEIIYFAKSKAKQTIKPYMSQER